MSDLHTNWSSAEKKAFVANLLRQHNEHPFDIIHFHYAVPFAPLLLEVRARLGARGTKLVGTLHGTDVSAKEGHHAGRPALCEALASMDSVTTVSKKYSERAQLIFNLPRRPKVIANFVDTSRFIPTRRSRAQPSNRPIRLVHVSNFRPVKNTLMIAQIFATIRRHVDAELWLVGEGEQTALMKTYLAAAGLLSCTRFFGFQREVHHLLRRADFLVMASLSESFCLAALEAMACGLPVVVPNVGGVPELVAHGKTGYLFHPHDAREAVRYVQTLASDSGLRRRMGRAAVQRARAFSEARVVTQYEDEYFRLLPRFGPTWPCPEGNMVVPASCPLLPQPGAVERC